MKVEGSALISSPGHNKTDQTTDCAVNVYMLMLTFCKKGQAHYVFISGKFSSPSIGKSTLKSTKGQVK